MKTKLKLSLLCAVLFAAMQLAALAGVASGAAASILIEAKTGRALFERNADARLPMASTTKIMTAIVVLEDCGLEDVVSVPAQASGVEGSSMYLEAGERLTVRQLMYGLMLWSGNDAATALALHTSGSLNAFVERMNVKAVELGAYDTRFANPHGLPDAGHYTTARDFAKIAAAAMRIPELVEIINTKSVTVPWAGHEWDRVISGKNKLLTTYDGANGVKTGYTKAAGRCLVGAAKRNGIQLISVVLNCPDMYNETAELLDYGFERLETATLFEAGESIGKANVLGGVKTSVELIAPNALELPLIKGESCTTRFILPEYVNAPIKKGDELGRLDVYSGDTKLYSMNVCANADVEEASVDYYLRKLSQDYINKDRYA